MYAMNSVCNGQGGGQEVESKQKNIDKYSDRCLPFRVSQTDQ